MAGNGTDPTADSQFQDLLGDAGNMNDFDPDLLGQDLDLDFSDPSFHQSMEPSLGPADPSQLPNVPQPSVELSQNQEQSQYASPSMGNDQEDAIDVPMSGIGAGPLPTGFGIQLPANVGSTLTDFTKRRNWSARVVEEIKDFLHILTPDGRIMYVSPSAKTLTGHETSRLVGKFMTSFVHPDDNSMYVREFNESIASGNPLRFFFRFRKADDTYRIFESHGHPHFSSDVSNFGGTSQSLGFCRGFFMMARPYPTKNLSLLDSFLEHKIENVRLQKRINDLRREEQEELQSQYMSPSAAGSVPPVGHGSHASLPPSEAQYQHQRHTSSGEAAVPPSPHAYNGMPPPAKPPISNFALTQRNLDEALAASRPDSINDKMMRYEGANHLEGIELHTGLRFREGERSKGISTGAMSPMLVRGDQGIEIPSSTFRTRESGDRHSDSPLGGDGEKKKKLKVTDEYVCTDCGTLDSPEWRRGPNGPKTLCNACGLRWAKQEKKRNGQLQSANASAGNGTAKPSPMVPGAGGAAAGAQQTPQASAGQNASSVPSQLPQQTVDSTSGGGGGGSGSSRANGATQQSGGQAVPAAGSSAMVSSTSMAPSTPMPGSKGQIGPGLQQTSPNTSMPGQPMQSMPPNTMSGSMPPSSSMPPSMSPSTMNSTNPMLGATTMGMQGAISGGGNQQANDPNRTLSGMGAMGYGGGPVTVNMDTMGMMGGQPQQGGYGDPGGGGDAGGQVPQQ